MIKGCGLCLLTVNGKPNTVPSRVYAEGVETNCRVDFITTRSATQPNFPLDSGTNFWKMVEEIVQ